MLRAESIADDDLLTSEQQAPEGYLIKAGRKRNGHHHCGGVHGRPRSEQKILVRSGSGAKSNIFNILKQVAIKMGRSTIITSVVREQVGVKVIELSVPIDGETRVVISRLAKVYDINDNAERRVRIDLSSKGKFGERKRRQQAGPII